MNHNSKITVIIATSTAPLEFLVQAVCSLILRTPIENIDQIIISINGPDSRTGDTLLQDQKQNFLEDLKEFEFPVTIIRTWSRLDASRAFQLCLPLVKTRYYLLMQDDLIIQNNDWLGYALDCFKHKECAVIMSGMILARKLEAHSPCTDLNIIDFYAMNMAFVLVDSEICPDNWVAYNNIPNGKVTNIRNFIDYHIDKNLNFIYNWMEGINLYYASVSNNLPMGTWINRYYVNVPEENKIYNFVNMPMGAWIYYFFQNHIELFQPKTIYHFCEASTKENTSLDANIPSCELKFLEDEINSSHLSELYYKYLPQRNREIKIPEVIENSRESITNGPLTLVVVFVYKRIEIVEKWMKHWYTKYNTYNSKIALVHNFDGEEPDSHDKARLLALKPDFYVPRFNRGQAIGILQDIVEKRLTYFQPNYDILVCFTDDTYPLHKDFLGSIFKIINPSHVGMVAPYIMPQCIRSTGFGIKRSVAEKLTFPSDPVISRLHCFQVETEMPRQIINMGFNIAALPENIVWDEDYYMATREELIGEEF